MFAVSALLASAAFAPAHAQTAEAAAERLKALLAQQEITIDWQSVEESGANAVLSGVTVGADDTQVEVGDVELTGISEVDDGYRVESLRLDEYVQGEPDDSFRISGLELTGLLLPHDENLADYGGFLFYETADIAYVGATSGGEPVFSLEGLNARLSQPEGEQPMSFTGGVESFVLEEGLVQEEQRVILEALGYERFEGHIEMAGTWQPTDGRLVLSQYDTTVAEAGTFSISLDVGGYTPDFIAALTELQTRMAANPEENNSAVGLGMLGLMQQLTFHHARIEFADDSLTERILEMIAESEGVEPADIANEWEESARAFLGMLNNPDFTESAASAVATFLAQPGSIAIVADPPSAAPFALVIAGALTAPQMLPTQLGLSVVANE